MIDRKFSSPGHGQIYTEPYTKITKQKKPHQIDEERKVSKPRPQSPTFYILPFLWFSRLLRFNIKISFIRITVFLRVRSPSIKINFRIPQWFHLLSRLALFRCRIPTSENSVNGSSDYVSMNLQQYEIFMSCRGNQEIAFS